MRIRKLFFARTAERNGWQVFYQKYTVAEKKLFAFFFLYRILKVKTAIGENDSENVKNENNYISS